MNYGNSNELNSRKNDVIDSNVVLYYILSIKNHKPA